MPLCIYFFIISIVFLLCGYYLYQWLRDINITYLCIYIITCIIFILCIDVIITLLESLLLIQLYKYTLMSIHFNRISIRVQWCPQQNHSYIYRVNYQKNANVLETHPKITWVSCVRASSSPSRAWFSCGTGRVFPLAFHPIYSFCLATSRSQISSSSASSL